MIPTYHAEKQRLEQAFKLANSFDYDEELLAHWARYLTILTAGFIENSVRQILTAFVESRAAPQVATYSQHHIAAISTLNEEKLRTLLGLFSPDWRSAFEATVSDEQKAAIDSIVANRHNIAHGRQVGITLARVRGYYTQVVDVVDWVARTCA